MIQNINNKAFNNITNGFSVPTGFIMAKKPSPVEIQPQNPFDEQNTLPSKNKHKIPLGQKVLYSVIALGSIALILTKGLSGATAKKIGRLADRIENNFLKKSGENVFVHYVDSGILNTTRFIKKLFSFSNAIANFTALKDTGFKKLYSLNFLKFKNPEVLKFPRLAKAWNWIVNLPTRFFDSATKNILKITESAIDSRYAKVARTLDNTSATGVKLLEKYNLPTGQKTEILSEIKNLNSVFQEGFSKISRNTRLNELEKCLSDVPEKVSDSITNPFRALKPKRKIPFITRLRLFGRRLRKTFSSYITMDKSKSARIKHQKSVNQARIAFSNDIGDVSISLKNQANELKHCFNPDDIQNRKMIGRILRKIENYSELSGVSEGTARAKLQKEITESLNAIISQVESLGIKNKELYSPQSVSEIKRVANLMNETLINNSEKGALQKIQTKMKTILSPKDYKIWCEKTRQLHSDFNSAVEAEMSNMVDKWAEAKVGSIATDVTSQLLVVGGGALHIANGDDKKEKIGATLKAGLPIVGGIATYFYSASKAFSGTTNLALTILSGYILNRIGDSVFKYYQKRFVEKKPVKEIAQEAVDDATKA